METPDAIPEEFWESLKEDSEPEKPVTWDMLDFDDQDLLVSEYDDSPKRLISLSTEMFEHLMAIQYKKGFEDGSQTN